MSQGVTDLCMHGIASVNKCLYTVEPVLKDHHIGQKKMWSLKTGGLW